MKLEGLPFTPVDWSTVPVTRHAGQAGEARWRTLQAGAERVRLVEYTAGYVADHWCRRGHVLLVLEGEIVTELESGQAVTLRAGMGYHVGDDQGAHRSRTEGGARLFIVD